MAADGTSPAWETGDATERSAEGRGIRHRPRLPDVRRAGCTGVVSWRGVALVIPVVLLPGLAPRCRAVPDVPQRHAVR